MLNERSGVLMPIAVGEVVVPQALWLTATVLVGIGSLDNDGLSCTLKSALIYASNARICIEV